MPICPSFLPLSAYPLRPTAENMLNIFTGTDFGRFFLSAKNLFRQNAAEKKFSTKNSVFLSPCCQFRWSRSVVVKFQRGTEIVEHLFSKKKYQKFLNLRRKVCADCFTFNNNWYLLLFIIFEAIYFFLNCFKKGTSLMANNFTS